MKSDRISIGGFDRLVRITKYTSLACLTLAILSTLILNIVSSYSSSKVNSNAEPVTQSTNGTLVSGPASISLSLTPIITPTSSQCDTSSSNICMSIPGGGRIATGGHTVTVDSNATNGYSVTITSSEDSRNSDLVLTMDDGNKDYDHSIGSLPIVNTTADSFTPINGTDGYLTNYDSSWGIAIPGLQRGRANSGTIGGLELPVFSPGGYFSSDNSAQDVAYYSGLPLYGDNSLTLYNDPNCTTTDQCINDFSFKQCSATELDNCTETDNDVIVAYAAKVTSPFQMTAGNYQAEVVYTATTNEVEKPTITNIDPNQYELGSNTNLDSNNRLLITITGTNLKSTYKVYLENNADSSKRYDITGENIASVTNTQLKITLPTDKTNPDLEPGEYTIHVVTQGTDDNGVSIPFTYTEKQLPAGIQQSTADYDSDGHVAVDYDENMIPITYTGNETTPKWTIADTSNSNSDTNLNWYDYPNKKWANAVTLTEEGLSLYKGKPVGTEIDEQYVLGYWVYIPRYAYKVMRKEVADKVVTDEVAKNNGKGGFEIVFETNNDIVKEPAICNSSNANQYYQDCIKNQYGEAGIDYPGNNEDLKDKTAWATHPAFTWQYTAVINGFDKTYELNGIWVGKFETTGNNNAQLVLPNKNYANNNFDSKGIGHFFDLGKSLGVYDENNPYGNTEKISDTRQNNHNLSASYSHMAKNSEWGAVAYLSSSKYGSGIGKVLANASSYTGRGSNKEKYQTNGGIKSSTTGTIYGIYDMSGGGYEIVAGGRTRSNFLPYTPKEEEYMMYLVRPPYINPYTFPSTNVTDPNKCSWESCGGHALHEIYNFQTITGQTSPTNIWGGNGSVAFFIGSSYPWFIRSGGATQGVYNVYMDSDKAYYADSFRAVLIAY